MTQQELTDLNPWAKYPNFKGMNYRFYYEDTDLIHPLDKDMIVTSSVALSKDHKEIKRCIENGLVIKKYNEILGELTDKFDSLLQNIKDIEAQGGGDIPEDLCSALEFAKNKKWKGRSRITILVTDSPCHGKKYYDVQDDENYDNYPNGDREGRNIEEYIKYLAENEISIFCLNINHSTDKMFKIFGDVFNKNKKKDSNNRFMVVSDNDIYKVVTTYAIETFRNRKPVEINE